MIFLTILGNVLGNSYNIYLKPGKMEFSLLKIQAALENSRKVLMESLEIQAKGSLHEKNSLPPRKLRITEPQAFEKQVFISDKTSGSDKTLTDLTCFSNPGILSPINFSAIEEELFKIKANDSGRSKNNKTLEKTVCKENEEENSGKYSQVPAINRKIQGVMREIRTPDLVNAKEVETYKAKISDLEQKLKSVRKKYRSLKRDQENKRARSSSRCTVRPTETDKSTIIKSQRKPKKTPKSTQKCLKKPPFCH
jgi:hypothetical protein